MLDLIKTIRDDLLADPTITAFVDSRIFWAFKPAANTIVDYPQITIMDSDGPTDSVTNDYFPDLQLHIWTRGDEKVTEGNKIARRILIRIDRKSFLQVDKCIFQVWKSTGTDLFEDETQTFHKVLTFNVVMQGYSD